MGSQIDPSLENGSVAAEDGPRSEEWLDKLFGYAVLKSGWDGYNAPGPSKRAILRSGTFLTRLSGLHLLPVRVAPSVVGGIGITFRNGMREVYVEFYNDGGIHALLSDDTTQHLEDVPLSEAEAQQAAFIARAGEYLNG